MNQTILRVFFCLFAINPAHANTIPINTLSSNDIELAWEMSLQGNSITYANHMSAPITISIFVSIDYLKDGRTVNCDNVTMICNGTEIQIITAGSIATCNLKSEENLKIYVKDEDFHNGASGSGYVFEQNK